jgi:WD40 repeat protein/class 3 adenylate cyclase
VLVFFFTDIEGSTRLWEAYTAEMGQVIARHDILLQQQIAAAGGRITKHTGDGITAAFEAGEPLACALETQKLFAAEPWGAIGELRIRVGLHAGEAEWLPGPQPGSGDYHGPPVNCSARIMSAAWGGQILLTPAVREVAPLPPQASLQDLGQHLLKNVSAPQQIYQLLHPELPRQEFPPPRTLSGQSIGQAVGQQGSRLAGLSPPAMAVGLASAALLPTLQGDLSASSAALASNLGVLGDLGASSLQDFLAGFAQRLQARREAGGAPTDPVVRPDELRQELEMELLSRWEAGGEIAIALRADASLLLQAVGGVEAALAAATADVKETLAQGLAELGGSFQEFRWMLDGLQQTLAEMRVRQALQLALQREQLDLQRQQLVKTNLLLQRQQERGVVLAPAGLLAADAEEAPSEMAVADVAPAEAACPYKGLAAFEAEDAEVFFGREELVAELTARLAGSRFLAVVGPSGSGKSSVVRAGLLPAIWGDALPGSKAWQTLVLTPGAHPLEELAVRLSLLSGHTPGTLLRDLEADYRCLHLAVKALLAGGPAGVQLLLVVDQFEEIFALCHEEGERRQFIDALLCAVEVEGSRTLVVPTIRADFYGRCADYPDLAGRMGDNVLVGPLREGELRQVIERPAEWVGLRLEPGLTEIIVNDVAEEPGALPLLSHALLETWERRRGRTLTLAGYAESGGVAGAIAQTADTVLEELSIEEQGIARGIFLRLTEFGEEGTQDTRRRVAPAELVRRPEEAAAVEAVLKTLADARLITTGGGPVLSEGEGPVPSISEGTVEVAHEALIREWPTLRGWLEEDREGLRVHRHLTEAAGEWARLERDPGELYRGARLAMAGEWAQAYGEEMNPLEREFLAASQEWAQRQEAEREAQRQRELEAERQRAEEQARNTRRLLWLVAALAVVFVLAVGAAIYAWMQADERERQADLITARHLATLAMDRLESNEQDAALLLAIEAVRAEDGAEARGSLLSALQYSPHLVAYLHGHPDTVTGVAFSPDGETLASGGGDGTILLWDVAAREPRGQPLRGHTDLVTAVAISPDGKILASVSEDHTVVLWDVAAAAAAAGGEPLGQSLAGHGDWVTGVVFSPDGETLASASYDRTVVLWDVATGKPVGQPLAGHEDWVLSVAFSPEGGALASGGQDGTIRLWDVRSGELLGEPLSGHLGWVNSLAFSPDGGTLASGGQDKTVRLWDLESGESLDQPLTGHDGSVESVAFSPEGGMLASGGQDMTVRLWAVAGEAPLGQPLRGHGGWVTGVAFSPDGGTLASSGRDGRVLLWDVAGDGLRRQTLAGHDDWVWSVAFSSGGGTLASASVDGAVWLWDVGSGQAIGQRLSSRATNVSGVAFAPDGNILAFGGRDGTVTLWDLARGEPLGEPLTGHNDLVDSLAFSPDGEMLASGDHNGPIILWDLESGQPLGQPLEGHGGAVHSLAFSPEGTMLASAGDDKLVILWDLAATSGAPPGQPLSGHTAPPKAVAFSPDGEKLASGGEDNTIILWDVAASAAGVGGEPLGPPLTGYGGDVEALAFSPDGKTLAAGGNEATIMLWDVATGQPLGQPLSGHSDWVNTLAFSPDGGTLASGANDGTVILWDAGLEAWQARACRIANRNLTAAEWKGYLGEQAYRETCPELP